MNLLHPTLLTALLATAGAGAQTPQAETPTPAVRTSSATGVATPYSDSYVPRSMRQPQRDIAPGPVLLRYTTVQKLKKRFEAADTDHSGTLNREEARQAGLGVVDKNFDSIDTAQRGNVSFDDLNAYLIQRREESGSR